MSMKRISVLSLSPTDLENLNKAECPNCGHALDIVRLDGLPVNWTCECCRTEFTTAK